VNIPEIELFESVKSKRPLIIPDFQTSKDWCFAVNGEFWINRRDKCFDDRKVKNTITSGNSSFVRVVSPVKIFPINFEPMLRANTADPIIITDTDTDISLSDRHMAQWFEGNIIQQIPSS
jgi:hypothetical protein